MTAYWALELPAADAPVERKRSERLRDSARWIALLADELDALDSGNYPRLRELAEQRAKLAAELGVDEAEGEEGSDPPPRPLHLELVAGALRELREWAEQERAKQEGLSQLRDDSLPLVRAIQTRTVGGRYQLLGEADSQLNVRM